MEISAHLKLSVTLDGVRQLVYLHTACLHQKHAPVPDLRLFDLFITFLPQQQLVIMSSVSWSDPDQIFLSKCLLNKTNFLLTYIYVLLDDILASI